MHRIDSIVPLGPVGMIIVLTAFILAIPLVVLFIYQQVPQGYRSVARDTPSFHSCVPAHFVDTHVAGMLYFSLAQSPFLESQCL